MRSRARKIFSFGGRIDVVVGALIVAVSVASLFVAIAARFGFPVDAVVLVPDRVVALQLWRLLTWSFVEVSPKALIFGLIFLYWIGGGLAVTWGARRFLRVYFGLATAAAVLTCLVGFVDPDVMFYPYCGTLAVASGLAVAWGLVHPDRQILISFVLPVAGRALVVLTVLITIVYGIYYGWQVVVPELLAEGLMAVYVRGPRLRRAKKKKSSAKARAPRVEIGRRGHIRLVEDDDER